MDNVHWPAIVQLHLHDELIYINTPQAWQDFLITDAIHLVTEDLLIDSSGQSYSFCQQANQHSLTPSAKLTVSQFIPVVQQFAQLQGHCCSSKLMFTSFEQGFAIIDQLD
jgi:hypothetical protein